MVAKNAGCRKFLRGVMRALLRPLQVRPNRVERMEESRRFMKGLRRDDQKDCE
jgi:hypothetical protein